jgi:pre-mRNA-splicing factor 38A
LVGKPREIFEYLEPLYNDYRKVREKVDVGYKMTHVDEFIEVLLGGDYSCDISLPYLPKRALLEETEDLPRRVSGLEDELDESDDEETINMQQSPTIISRSPSIEREKER